MGSLTNLRTSYGTCDLSTEGRHSCPYGSSMQIPGDLSEWIPINDLIPQKVRVAGEFLPKFKVKKRDLEEEQATLAVSIKNKKLGIEEYDAKYLSIASFGSEEKLGLIYAELKPVLDDLKKFKAVGAKVQEMTRRINLLDDLERDGVEVTSDLLDKLYNKPFTNY